jgi:hypothetical protein
LLFIDAEIKTRERTLEHRGELMLNKITLLESSFIDVTKLKRESIFQLVVPPETATLNSFRHQGEVVYGRFFLAS